MLREISEADLVVDLCGDLYGDNSSPYRFIQENIRLAIALLLRKPTCMVAGSPGPFHSRWRASLAKLVLRRLTLVTNREPLSTRLLAKTGLQGPNIVTAACPSVLFRQAEGQAGFMPPHEPRLLGCRRPLFGIILCGWNMPLAPYSRWPRADSEYVTFVELIRYILTNLPVSVCVMSHQNATDGDLNLIPGNDHRIISQLLRIMGTTCPEDRLFTLDACHDAVTSRRIISRFAVLMSGRIHGAIQGLSQGVPTAIIDYGHTPKAHKLQGFAELFDIEDYVADPNDATSLIQAAETLWTQRAGIREALRQSVPTIQASAMGTLSLVRLAYSATLWHSS